MKSLKRKRVFITGASSGIGMAAAYRFAKAGADLILCARRMEKLKENKAALEKRYGISVKILQIDVRKYAQVKKAVEILPEKWKEIDILVNNAGLSRGLNKIQDGKLNDWDEMIDTNVKGLLYVSKIVIPLMIANGKGHIINIGSIAGHEVYPAGNVYCASKHAVDALTKGMRMDLIDTPLKVTTIDPGLVETEFSVVRFRGDEKRAKSVYTGMKPLTPEDVADALYYAATVPDNVVVAQLLLLPKAQASSVLVKRFQ